MKSNANLFIFGLVVLSGCAVNSSVQPVSSSTSGFDGAVYGGETVIVGKSTKGSEEYRLFQQGGTGFTQVESLKAAVYGQATNYCAKKSKTLNPVQETRSVPPHVMGNFPRFELIFECN
jgi:hypothetical protein